MAEFFQLLIIGLSQGCVYGLIAMGFVMIYKATEMVNFAQGDIMMIGSFVAFTIIVTWGFNFWLGLLLAMVVMAVFGFLVDAIVVRRIIGQPQFSIVILTISLGFIFRAAAGMIWGQGPFSLDTPFADTLNFGDIVIGHDRLAIMGRHGGFGRAAVSVSALQSLGHCHAGRLAKPIGGFLRRYSGEAGLFGRLGSGCSD